MRPLRIGTRGSALAMWQARAVATALERLGAAADLVTITTRGDRSQDLPLAAIGGKGVFVKEIHDALLTGEIDLAVHSAKDMPAVSLEGLTIGAVLAREDPRDALVLPVRGTAAPRHPLDSLQTLVGASPAVGTGSPRRIAQLRRIFPNARFEPIRGNVDTRLRKLDAGEMDAVVLACAGLRRLRLAHRITAPIPVSDCVPAPGQGIIAIEARSTDDRVLERLDVLNDPPARIALAAEQALVAELGGGCQLPLGAFAEIHSGELSIRAVAASLSGTTMIEGETTGNPNNPVEAGMRLARDLASRGARELLNT
ncbi:MAG TPA: hydroxymethylbilane synthase [Vicinamibacterales bacterium]|nr:hydroxymethylbilane synthase [Vicinamibacterales bacterium]